MRNRFGRALGTLAGAAVLSGALGAAVTGAASAATPPGRPATPPGRPAIPRVRPAATPACGISCANYFVQRYGRGVVLNDFRGRQASGTPVIIYHASNANKDEDWTIWPAGTVAQLASFGLVSPALELHYGTDQAFELEYAPDGVGTGKCAGTAGTAANGEQVTLQWCGRSARTVWVIDSADLDSRMFAPLINGSDTDFSDPQVLTEHAAPRWPRLRLVSSRLQKFANGTIDDNQLWTNTIGVLPRPPAAGVHGRQERA
jgi:hypothetical protein